jgi:hypothetical protein
MRHVQFECDWCLKTATVRSSEGSVHPPGWAEVSFNFSSAKNLCEECCEAIQRVRTERQKPASVDPPGGLVESLLSGAASQTGRGKAIPGGAPNLMEVRGVLRETEPL